MSDSEDTGTMIMCAYILDGKYPTAEEQYKQALADFGFQFIISDEVDGVLMHGYALNGDITDYRVLYAYDSSVMVIGVIRPNSQQVPNQYYTEHPDILNFGDVYKRQVMRWSCSRPMVLELRWPPRGRL